MDGSERVKLSQEKRGEGWWVEGVLIFVSVSCYTKLF